jgi:mono/diheme cytochrome c family protein
MSQDDGRAALRSTALAALLAGCTSAIAQLPTSDGNAARGEQLYYDHACYGCHGYGGQTGAHDLVGTGSPVVENEQLFVSFLRLRADLAPLFPSTRMPSYSESALTDAEARDLFAYIRTFRLDRPEAEEIPALQAILESAARPSSDD